MCFIKNKQLELIQYIIFNIIFNIFIIIVNYIQYIQQDQ